MLSPSYATVSLQLTSALNITPMIEHNLASVERPQTINYHFTLHYGSTVKTLSTLNNTQVTFPYALTCDTYSRVSVTAENCAGGSGTVYSKYLILPGKLYQ